MFVDVFPNITTHIHSTGQGVAKKCEPVRNSVVISNPNQCYVTVLRFQIECSIKINVFMNLHLLLMASTILV